MEEPEFSSDWMAKDTLEKRKLAASLIKWDSGAFKNN